MDDKPRNKGGRPNAAIPNSLRVRMKLLGLKPTWDSLGAVFGYYVDNGTHTNAIRNLMFESKLGSVEQFIVAAETLKMTPRELFDVIQFNRRVREAKQASRTKPALPVSVLTKRADG